MSQTFKEQGPFDEQEAARLLKLGYHTLRRRRYAGEIGHRKAGRRVLYTADDLAAYLERIKVEARGGAR